MDYSRLLSYIAHNISKTWLIPVFILVLLPAFLSMILALNPWCRGRIQRFFSFYRQYYNGITGGALDVDTTLRLVWVILLRMIGAILLGYVVWLITYSIPNQ